MRKIWIGVAATATVAIAAGGVAVAVSAAGERNGQGAAPPTTAPAVTEPPTTEAPTTTELPTTTTPPTTSPPTTSPPPTVPPTTAPPPPPEPALPADPTLRRGHEGEAVRALQERLVALGYWLGEPDSTYGRLTQQAVMAFQKAHGLERDGIAGPATLAALDAPVALAPRSAVDGVEIDLDRQLMLIVEGGVVKWALNTSTGTTGWRTPRGEYSVDRTIDGMRHAPLGDLYRPAYFNGGIAMHGSSSIPGYPASHGCARVSFAAMDMLWATGVAATGTPVHVY